MSGRPQSKPRFRNPTRWAGAALLAALWAAGPIWGQAGLMPPSPSPGADTPAVAPAVATTAAPAAPDSAIVQTSCTACGGGLPVLSGTGAGCDGCDGLCVPGRRGCDCHWEPDTLAGRFLFGLYECLCCPDPCYDPPKWLGVADEAFFQDAARPITQMRIRIDSGFQLKNPDRGEYFWARQQTPTPQVLPTCNTPNVPGKGPTCIARTVNYDELTLYNEAATGRVGVFVEVPYRELKADPGAVNTAVCCSQSAFADINAGTKTLLLDCELIQLTFQFKVFIPTGSTGKGMGTGHTSLEPALLMNLKLDGHTYLQAESAYWIPIGGDQLYQANIWHNHASLNRILWCPCRDLQLIGNAEINEWSVFGGAYTIPDYTDGTNFLAKSGTTTIVSGGPGVRGVLCEKYDLGVGSAFAFTGTRWAKELVRVEFRWRF